MSSALLIDRFIGGNDARRRLVDSLGEQRIVGRNAALATAIADVASIHELAPGELLIRQGDADTDVYFVLVGRLRVLVNDNDVAVRAAGEHVGEMAMLDRSLPRTATIVASAPTVVAKVSEHDFQKVGGAFPGVWRSLAIELAKRLHQRARFHLQPNAKPIVFIGSSTERLPLATAISAGMPGHLAVPRIWTAGVFGASNFPIEDLTAQVKIADFAILVAGADDRVTSRGIEADAPRDNVVFELGLFMGSISRQRTFLVVPKGVNLKIPTDLLGMNCVRYNPAVAPDDAAKDVVEEIGRIIAKLGPK